MIKLDQTKSMLVDKLIENTSRKIAKTFNIAQYAKELDINELLFKKTVDYLEEVGILEKAGEAYKWGYNKQFLRKQKQLYYLHL